LPALSLGASTPVTRVGATLLFLGSRVCSSFSDSLASRFPKALPLTELGLLMTPDIGVCGGVVHGSPPKDGLAAATLGTLPMVGVGLLMIACDDSVAIEDIEFDRVGLGGGGGAGEAGNGNAGVGGLSNDGGADAVGVGTGVGCADPAVEIGAGDGW